MDPLTAMLPEIDSNKEYPFNKDDYINYLLGNSLHSGSKRPKQGFGYHRSEIIVDIDTEYYYNNFGYRSSDWHAGSSILAVGCSNTFALGVPIEYSWPQILSTKINKDEIRREASPERVEYKKTTLRSRSPSLFKPKKKSKIVTKVIKKSTKKVTKKKSKKKSKK